MFQCFIDRCMEGVQFCETQSQRCRNCKDYIDFCFKDNFHISNCSSYCYDLMVKNITSRFETGNPRKTFWSEISHFIIESAMGFLIVALLIMVIYPKFQFLPCIARRIISIMQAKEDTTEKNETKPLNTQYPTEEGNEMPEVQVSICNRNKVNCGFTQHNQIPNATKDDPLLCLSGRKENIDSVIT